MTHEHLDVLIIGAGLSGIGAAHHLQRRHPGRSIALLEKLGMHAEGTTRMPGEDAGLLLYAKNFEDGAENPDRSAQ